ncbi:hypothetical protein HN747_01665 [archaeon]|jgi:hypothetical protein|nr:hypothetical protein [archaeon]
MEEITGVIQESIHPLMREILLARIESLGEENLMNMRLVHFNSLSELKEHYEELKPLYAFVHGVRFRDPNVAYTELTGYESRKPFKRNELILQDRMGGEWCWGSDKAIHLKNPKTWLGSTISKSFSDHEVIDMVVGRANFGATFSGPVRHIDISGYRGRISNPGLSRERNCGVMPSFSYARA